MGLYAVYFPQYALSYRHIRTRLKQETSNAIKRMRTSESFVLNWILLLVTLESAGVGLVFYQTKKVKQSGIGNLYSGAKLTNINYLSILKIYTKSGF